METAAATTITDFVVTVDTPAGELVIDIKASSADLAWKRTWLTLVHNGYGDLDEVTLVEVTEAEPDDVDDEGW